MRIRIRNQYGRDGGAQLVSHGKPKVELNAAHHTIMRGTRTLEDIERLGDASELLAQGDPEFDPVLVGRAIGKTSPIYLLNGEPVSQPFFRRILTKPDKTVVDDPWVTLPATVQDDVALLTRRCVPISSVLRRCVLYRTLQLVHEDGAGYAFLFAIAEELAESQTVAMVQSPVAAKLRFRADGRGNIGFLEGRVHGSDYMLLLRLSQHELKGLPS